MAPTTEKPKHVYTPPSFIDQTFIKTLPKDKQEYWANRVLGKPGQGEAPKTEKMFSTPQDIVMGFDNNGNMVAKTREMRRAKTPSDTKYRKKQLIPKRKR